MEIDLTPRIGINDFCKMRHSSGTRHSEFVDGQLERVVELAVEYFKDARPAEKDGMILIRVPSAGFLSPVVKLEAGDDLVGTFDVRVPCEAPRKSIGIVGNNSCA